MADGQTQGPCANWSFDTTTNQINTAAVSHDAAGNLLTDGTGVGTYSYQWDAEGRLKQVVSRSRNLLRRLKKASAASTYAL